MALQSTSLLALSGLPPALRSRTRDEYQISTCYHMADAKACQLRSRTTAHLRTGHAMQAPNTRQEASWQLPAADGAQASVAVEQKVREVGIGTYHGALEGAGEKLVVLDLYTQWCGPCKLLAPKIEALVEEYPDVVFLKMDCNQENKPLAKELGVRVVPTFKLYKNKEIIGEVRGAKFDVLLAEIKKLR